MKSKIDIKTSSQNIKYFDALGFYGKKGRKNCMDNKENEMLWFLNHNHVYTCGTSSKKNEILVKKNIPILQTNRGGKTTYHGPGQRIVYFMINLNKRKKDIRKFVNIIENSTISLLKELDIEATTFPERVGIWVIKSQGNKLLKEKKIGAIGLRVKKWITYHGLSFNINPDLKFYENINACGLNNYSSTSLKDLCINLTNKEFDIMYKKKFNNEISQM